MESLLFFGLWAIILFMTMRAVCGTHVMGHHAQGQSSPSAAGDDDLRWVPPEMDKDPVCGKTVKTADARPSVFDGRVFYFCSRECREVFEAAPHLHVNRAEKTRPKQLEVSHE